MLWGPAVSRHLHASPAEIASWDFRTLIRAHAVMDYCAAAERIAREDAEADHGR